MDPVTAAAEMALLDLPAPAAPATTTTGLTAKHMEQMLRRHYLPEGRPAGGIFAPEIASPCGKRRADLIWMPTTIAGGKGELHGHETKVSRADLLNELADPTKADPWGQYCTRWWLVVPTPSLINGLTIPDAWGVLAPPSGRRTRTMTVVKEAPLLVPRDPAPGIARLAAWQMYGTNDRIVGLQRDLAYQKRLVEEQRQELAHLRAGGAQPPSRDAQRVAGIVAALNRTTGRTGLWGGASDDEIVAAIVDHVATRSAARSVRMQMRGVVRAVERIVREPLGYALDELKQAEKLAADPATEVAS